MICMNTFAKEHYGVEENLPEDVVLVEYCYDISSSSDMIELSRDINTMKTHNCLNWYFCIDDGYAFIDIYYTYSQWYSYESSEKGNPLYTENYWKYEN